MSLSEWIEAVLEGKADRPADHDSRRQPSVPDASNVERAFDTRFEDREQPRANASFGYDSDDRPPLSSQLDREPDPIEHRLGRLVSALGSNVPVQREEVPKALRTIEKRLDRLSEKPERDASERRATRDTVRQLEDRLQAIAQRMESGHLEPDARDLNHREIDNGIPEARPPFVSRRKHLPRASEVAEGSLPPAPINGLKEAISEIASRQRSLESEFERAVGSYADRVDHRLDSVAERIEQSIEEALPGSALRDLQDEIRSVAGNADSRQSKAMGDLLVIVSDLAHRIETIPGRVGEDLAERLEDTVRRLDTATRAEIDSIRGELREMAQDLDRVTRSEFDALRAEISGLAERVGAAPAGLSPDVEARIEDIADRLDTAARSEFGAIRAEIRQLAEQMDRNGRDEFEALRGDLQALGERLSSEYTAIATRGGDDTDPVDFDAIRSEIRGLSVQIDGARRDEYDALRQDMQQLGERISEAPSARIGELERHLILLTEQLAKAAQDEDPETLAQLEEKIALLAENVDSSARNMAGIDGLEKTIAELFNRVDNSRADALDAARDAAKEAVERAVASLSGGGGNEVFDDLRTELKTQRANAEAADQRTQTTLHAVHETLKTIVDRLEDLEYEVDEVTGESRAPREPAPEADVKPAALDPDDIVGRIDAVARSFRTDTDAEAGDAENTDAAPEPAIDDLPLAPGTGQPKASFTDEDTADENAADEDTDASTKDASDADASRADVKAAGKPAGEPAADDAPAGGRSDFVAAARRAAQAATAEQAGGKPGSAGDRRLAGDRPQRLKGLKSGISKYRRPLAIAAAMVIIVFGAVKIATYVKNNPGLLSIGGLSTGFGPTGSGQTASAQTGSGQKTAKAAPETKSADARPIRTVGKSKAGGGQSLGGAQGLTSNGTTTGSIPDPATATAEASVDAASNAPTPNADQTPPAGPANTTPATDDSAIPADMVPEQLRLAALAAEPSAQFEMAVRYMDARGLPQSAAKAAEWYRKAAAQGLAPAQYRLGSLYEKGQGVAKDLAMARMWYQRAAEQGNRKAMHNLAVLYADGVDGKPDYEKAATWFRQAAEYGLGDSQFNLAVLFARGLGVNADMGESFRWFAIAADQGDGEALNKRDEVARSLNEEELRKARARLDAWEPKHPEASANIVPEPQGGWGDVKPMQQAYVNRDMVATAQSLLNALGYSAGPSDGQIGPKTRDAVRAFQRSVGMADTGDITPELVEKLDSAAG